MPSMRSTLGIRSTVRDRVTVELRQNRQIKVARETVQRYMREMGIAGICPGPNLSRRNAAHKIYPYLLRNVTAARPNHVWGIRH